MNIWSRLRRIRNSQHAIRNTPVELDLHQQLAVLALHRFGPCDFQRLLAEAGGVRPVTQAEMANGVLKLEAGGVIERHAERGTPHAQRRYALTRRGRRIARYLPPDPHSAMEFYL